MLKLYKIGNSVVWENGGVNIQSLSVNFKFRYASDDLKVIVFFQELELFNGLISEITDDLLVAYTKATLQAFVGTFNMGGGGGTDTGGIIFVDSIEKLPPPTLNTYTLTDSYFFTRKIDFEGANLVLDGCSIIGASQEKAGITNANVSIISTITLNWLRFDVCSINIDAIGGAFDWTKLNFYGCNYLTIQNASNFILESAGFINSLGVNIIGTVDSVVISPNSIWRSADVSEGIPTPTGYDTTTHFNIASTAVINRRIRIQDSVFVTSEVTQKAINIDIGSSVNTSSFILKVIGFVGAGVAVTGINGDDDRALFDSVTGGNTINSAIIGSMVMKNNTTETIISVQNDRYKVAGTFQAGEIMQGFQFDAVNNALEYISSIPRVCVILAPFTAKNASGNNVTTGSYIGVKKAVNPTFNPDVDRLSDSEQYVTTRNDNTPNSGTCLSSFMFEEGDKIYLITQNRTGMQNITHEFVNILVQRPST